MMHNIQRSDDVPRPIPPDDPPGYTLRDGPSRLRPSERPLGRAAPTDLSSQDIEKSGWPWWVWYAGFWILVGAAFVGEMIIRGTANAR